MKVSRATARNYLKKHPELEDLINEEKENLLDFTESKLIKKIKDEESWAINNFKYFTAILFLAHFSLKQDLSEPTNLWDENSSLLQNKLN